MALGSGNVLLRLRAGSGLNGSTVRQVRGPAGPMPRPTRAPGAETGRQLQKAVVVRELVEQAVS